MYGIELYLTHLNDDNPEDFSIPYHENIDFQKSNDSEIDLKEYAVIAPGFLAIFICIRVG